MKSKKGIVGFVALVAIILSLVGTQYWMNRQDEKKRGPQADVTCLVGGEKIDFLNDPNVQELLKTNNIKLNALKRGSIEMVSNPSSLGDNIDCVLPSNQVALAMFKANGGNPQRAENVFNSPIVIYSWTPIVDVLMKKDIVSEEPNPAVKDAKCGLTVPADQKKGCVYYVDFEALVTLVESGTSWKDLGMQQLYGPVRIHSTDPTKSNSGNMYAGLLANTLTGGLATEANIASVQPRINRLFENQGFMSESSGDIFEQYIEQGIGTYPLVVGYENQIVEFSTKHKDEASLSNRLASDVRILYPRPTVWSQHPLIALNDEGSRFLDVLLGPEMQRIAWESHGFRSGTAGRSDSLDTIPVSSQVPPEITSGTDMPSVGTMKHILNSLEQPEAVPTTSPATRRDWGVFL